MLGGNFKLKLRNIRQYNKQNLIQQKKKLTSPIFRVIQRLHKKEENTEQKSQQNFRWGCLICIWTSDWTVLKVLLNVIGSVVKFQVELKYLLFKLKTLPSVPNKGFHILNWTKNLLKYQFPTTAQILFKSGLYWIFTKFSQ